MNQHELKSKLHGIISAYFSGAEVVWSRSKKVMPNSPFVLLTPGDVIRHYHPITGTVGEITVHGYPSKTSLQVDLFTSGARRPPKFGVIEIAENTAVSDLLSFANYISSDYVSDRCFATDISIMTSAVKDMTGLTNDMSWEYRAMLELEIFFTDSSVGYTGLNYENDMPYFDNGCPKYDDNGVPLYPNGRPMYDADGNTLDDNGNIVSQPLDEDGNPLLPPIRPDGRPPYYMPDVSGGGSKNIANQSDGWFERIETPIEQEEK